MGTSDVGGQGFATDLSKILSDTVNSQTGNASKVNRFMGAVSAYNATTNIASVYLMGSASASGGFKARGGFVPVAGQIVVVYIDGQDRWIENILRASDDPYFVRNGANALKLTSASGLVFTVDGSMTTGALTPASVAATGAVSGSTLSAGGLNVYPTDSGSAFPTGAALTAYGNNRPFWRTDLGKSAYYDGTRWLGVSTEYVGLSAGFISAVADNTTTTSNVGANSAELTALPAAGLVALHVQVSCSSTVAHTSNGAGVTDFGGVDFSAGVLVWAGAAAGYIGVQNGFVKPGGTNGRQITYFARRGNGTVSYGVRVVGYLCHPILT